MNLNHIPPELRQQWVDKCGGEEKKYVGFVERPNMEEIVSEAMKEVYSKHTANILNKQVGGTHYKK